MENKTIAPRTTKTASSAIANNTTSGKSMPAVRQAVWYYNREAQQTAWKDERETEGVKSDTLFQLMDFVRNKFGTFFTEDKTITSDQLTALNGWTRYNGEKAQPKPKEEAVVPKPGKKPSYKQIGAWVSDNLWPVADDILSQVVDEGDEEFVKKTMIDIAKLEIRTGVQNPAWTPGGKEDTQLTRRDAKGIDAYTKRLMKQFPPGKFNYVSVGSSPALFTEYIQTLDDNAVVLDLPISNVRLEDYDPTSKTKMDRLMDFVHHAVERSNLSVAELAAKPIVILDEVIHGSAIVVAEALIQKYLERNGKAQTTTKVSLTQVDPKLFAENAKKNQGKGLDFTIKNWKDERVTELEKEVRLKITQCYYKNMLGLRYFSTSDHDFNGIQSGDITTITRDFSSHVRMMAKLLRIQELNK